MEVEPKYDSVGNFFQGDPAFRVPKYQRSYAWEQLEIDDFVKDFESCYRKRQLTNPIVHFFGQIVCIAEPLQGTEGKKYFDLVDGQQRVATFVLLVVALINTCKEVILEIAGDITRNNEKGILEKRIADLQKRFIKFDFEINNVIQSINVLELSKHDKTFFNSFLENISEETTRESHVRIKNAYTNIFLKVKNLTYSANLLDRLSNLKSIEHILNNDFCILNVVTTDREAAFKLFQVLNNRGKNLTEGDLLRAESLRLLENHSLIQDTVESLWDDVLIDKPTTTETFLRAIYGSHSGKEVGNNSLFNEFLNFFLPQNSYEHILANHADEIKIKVQGIQKDVATLRLTYTGQWPHRHQLPVEHWDRNRLYLLIHALNHTECLPFLLSATTLDHRVFNDIVQIIERFVFRYHTICKQYIGDLIKLYHDEAKYLRENAATYSIDNLKTKLGPLEAKADDIMFRRLLDDLEFHKVGKSNKPLKYFLLTLEYFFPWYKEGAAGIPGSKKEAVYDFNDSTIEHIYPQSASGSTRIVEIEPLKNTIGNLTILSNQDNRTGENDDFVTKKPIYLRSALAINRDISAQPDWTKEKIESRTIQMKDMACKIFKV